MSSLADLRPGESGRIVSLNGPPALTQRLYELGVLEGDVVEMIGLAPLGDPVEVRIGNTRLSLRKIEAAVIAVHLV